MIDRGKKLLEFPQISENKAQAKWRLRRTLGYAAGRYFVKQLKFTKKWGNSSGFTLLEVMIAIAILGISLVLTLQLFAGALYSTSMSRHYTEATFLVRHKLEEISLDNELPLGTQEGDFGEEHAAYSWQAEVDPYPLPQLVETPEEGKARPQVVQIRLKVSWEERGKTHNVELVTLNTALQEPEI